MRKEKNGFGSIYTSSHFGPKKPSAIKKVKTAIDKGFRIIKKNLTNGW